MANRPRRYSASDIRRYARCPRQWWYETRRDDLAALEPAELERRMAALRRRHGASAADMTAYQLLADLAARQGRLEQGRAAHLAHAARVSRRAGCLLPLGGSIVLLLCSIALALCIHERGCTGSAGFQPALGDWRHAGPARCRRSQWRGDLPP